MKFSALQLNLLIVFAGLILFVPFLGTVHLFDWDEINFAECAREMIVSGDYSFVKINFLPFWEKPPLFIWMQVASMKIFGINEFAARLPNAICGIITLLLVFNIGSKIYDTKFGLIWALAFAGSFLPHFYFKSGIIDPWFNLFIFLSIYYFIQFFDREDPWKNISSNTKTLIFSALFISLAIMTKGPVALLILGLCFFIYWLSRRFKSIIALKYMLIYGSTVFCFGGLWFAIEALQGHGDLISSFIQYQIRLLKTEDSGHGGPFLYHFIVLLIGCFPVSVFAIRAFKENEKDTVSQKLFKTWMLILFWVVLLLFSIVKTKIVHYSSLCYFPLTFLGAYTIYKILNNDMPWKKWMSYTILLIGGLLGSVISMLPAIDKYKTWIISTGIIKDRFAVANLQANVHWNGSEFLLGLGLFLSLCFFIFYIKRKNFKIGIIGIFVTTLFTVNTASLVVAPKIEQYSQGAAIEFYEHLKDEDCYIETLGFKSYAYLFYSNKQEQENLNNSSTEWLLTEPVDKPCYFVSKITDEEKNKTLYPTLEQLYKKNGFVFYRRKI